MWLILGLFIILIVTIAIVWSNPSYITGGSIPGELIFISFPPNIKFKSKTVPKDTVIINQIDNDDKLIAKVKSLIVKHDRVIVVGHKLRDDITRLTPSRHIHICPVSIDTSTSNVDIFHKISTNRDKFNLTDKLWQEYWDGLCHMTVTHWVTNEDAALEHTAQSVKTGSSEISQIQKDYNRFLTTLKRLEIIRKNNPYEATNILERWTQSVINDGLDPFGPIADINSTASMKMLAELKDKNINNEREIVKAICNVHESDDTNHTVSYKDGIINYGIFHSSVPKIRLDKMIEIAGLDATASACMRYAALVSGSQQWAVPLSTYRMLHDKHGINVEGFASPINSQMMWFDDGKFCSIFPEDNVFGSMGNFMDSDLKGASILINSPFIESILERVADKVSNANLEKNKIIVVVPTWRDAKFFRTLSKIPGGKRIDLMPGEYSYEDINRKLIRAKFASSWFMFGIDLGKHEILRM